MTQPIPPTASTSSGVAALQAVLLRHLRQWWPIPLVALLAAIVERLWRAPEPVAWAPLLLMAVTSGFPAVLDDLWTGAATRFALARPVVWWAWWGGRLAAAILLVALSIGLLGLPALVTGASFEAVPATWLTEQLTLVTFLGLAITFIAAVRTGAIGSALVVVAGLVAFWWSPLVVDWAAGSSNAGSRGRLLLASLGVVTFALASAAVVAAGRGDPRRAVGTAALVWGLAAVPLGGWAAWRWAYPLPPPALGDLWRVEVAHATGDGEWLHVGGFADGEGGRRHDFLVNAHSGRWQRLPTVWNRLVAFDAEARRVAWIEYPGRNGVNPALVVAALEDQGGLVVERRHALEYRQPRFDALILRGNRVAIIAPEWVQLRDADSGGALATAVRSGPQRLAALTGDGALVFARDTVTGGFDVRDVEVMLLREGQGEEVLMTVGDLARGDTLTLRPDGQQLLVCRADRRAPPIDQPLVRATTYDVGRKTVLASADIPRGLLSAGFLGDGRAILASRVSDRRTVITAFGAGRSPVQTELGEASGGVLLGGQVRPGVIAVGVGDATGRQPTTLLIDVDAGDVTSRLPGVLPLVRARIPQDEDAWRASAPRQVFFTGPRGILAIDDGSDEPRVAVESARAADWLAPAR